MRGSAAYVASSGGGDGYMISHVSGERLSGSAASRLWKNVVPARGRPITKIGWRIISVAMAGWRLRSSTTCRRVQRLSNRRRYARCSPSAFNFAVVFRSRIRTSNGSRNSSLPQSDRSVACSAARYMADACRELFIEYDLCPLIIIGRPIYADFHAVPYARNQPQRPDDLDFIGNQHARKIEPHEKLGSDRGDGREKARGATDGGNGLARGPARTITGW
ncbi:conserved hypothetical protein [Ricinus communis]|uniref:Uncharacterized protein n=1 Tax=Ricinus communis TaxID=3988 RepID=B9TJ08_RICCO|nr:conserved hypothetical protein [Ricinus communis]